MLGKYWDTITVKAKNSNPLNLYSIQREERLRYTKYNYIQCVFTVHIPFCVEAENGL